ncbi:hypothetical protein Q1695_016087 [Nippostrongylus brasiliensis]|nr:hypothetical protein Q1695_016087 [Nippostrongylus brasiliensis]
MLKQNEEERWMEERQKAIEEWSDIELRFPDGPPLPPPHTSLPGSADTARPSSAGSANGHYFHDADPLIEEILNEDYSQEMSSVASTVRSVQPTTLDLIVNKCLCRPKPHLESHSLKRERTLLIALSTVSYCNASTSQWSLLHSFYTTVAPLVPNRPSLVSNCPRKGAHWQTVGFQGSDPSTDFRGTGILGLIQLYSMVKELDEADLAQVVHLSRNEPHDFPLAVVGINITSILLTRLRNAELLESAVTCGGYLKAMNKLYRASLLEFCKQWKEEKCTVKDCQHVLNRITILLRDSQQTLLNFMTNGAQ